MDDSGRAAAETIRKADALADRAFQLLWHEAKPEEAAALYRQAIALLEPLEKDENAYDARRMLIDWHEMLQYALGDMEDNAGTAAQSEAALRLARRLTNDWEDRICLGDRLQDYAGVLTGQGAWEPALGLWREAFALWAALAGEKPAPPLFRECAGNASECCRKAADILSGHGERSDAIDLYLQSAAWYEKALGGEDAADGSLGRMLEETAKELEKLEAWQDAAALHLKALEHLRNVDSLANRWGLPDLCQRLSRALEKSGRSEEATEYTEKGRIFQTENEKKADALRQQLAGVRAQHELGRQIDEQGRTADALRAYDEAIIGCKRLMQCLPEENDRLQCAQEGLEIVESALRLLQKTAEDDNEEEKEKGKNEMNVKEKERLHRLYFDFSRELSRVQQKMDVPSG